MLHALALSLGQLGDPRLLRLLARSIAVTLLLLVVLGAAGWWALDSGLGAAGLTDARFGAAGPVRATVALVAVVLAGWLLWRAVAFAVLQFFADEVVDAVEARHYPAARDRARPIGAHEEIVKGIKSAVRAVAWNLLALPFALVLLVTGVGTPLLFWGVNAVLIGRELMDMVWLRHRRESARPPLSRAERFALGGIVAALLVVPGVNFLAPFLGAAMATHLIHRKGVLIHVA